MRGVGMQGPLMHAMHACGFLDSGRRIHVHDTVIAYGGTSAP